jgi:hypothetical protein
MNLSIIIVSYNTRQLLKNCLDSIYTQNDIDLEVIVVDNNSSDGSVEMIKEYFPDAKLIENDTNVGFGKANNQGARVANGKYLLFINSDIFLQNNAIKEIDNYLMKTENNIGLAGFKILNKNNTLQPSCGNFPTLLNLTAEALFLDRAIKLKKPYHILDTGKYQKEFGPDWFSGSLLAVSRDIFKAVRGFDENFFLYVEEVDLCYRIRQKGYNSIYVPCASAVHSDRASSKSKKTAVVLTHHNLLYFFNRHHNHFSTTLIYLLFIFKSLVYSVLGMFLGIFNQELKDKSNIYSFLLISLIFKTKYKKYEDTLKQQI